MEHHILDVKIWRSNCIMGKEMEGSILTLSFAKIDTVTKNKGHKTRSFHSLIIFV